MNAATTARTVSCMMVGLAVLVLAQAAPADWNTGDPHKMHFPQLPDPQGWDVAFVSSPPLQPHRIMELADDWQCSETGPVEDIHFWISWRDEAVGIINGINVAIYDNVEAGAGGFSHPGDKVWGTFQLVEGDFAWQWYGEGDQGWFDPPADIVVRPDHVNYYQVNITDLAFPFEQEEGEIYWLGVSVNATMMENVGWKTSLDHWNDNAVYLGVPEGWQELMDPGGGPIDLAFVITPEPATLALLGVGLAGLLARRKK